jgi:hypothetical protein
MIWFFQWFFLTTIQYKGEYQNGEKNQFFHHLNISFAKIPLMKTALNESLLMFCQNKKILLALSGKID